MKIGISRFSSTPEESQEVFAAARRYGFDGVQVKPHQYNCCDMDPEIFKSTYGQFLDLAQAGLVAYPRGPIETWPSILEPIIPFAAGIGAEQICMCGGTNRSDTSREAFRSWTAVLTEIGQEARRQGTRISVHNHPDCLYETGIDMDWIVEDLDPDICGLTLDTACFAQAGEMDVASLARRYRDYVTNVHLKDFSEDGVFCPLGEGTLDLDTIIDTLFELGYDNWLVVDEESRGYKTNDAYRIDMAFLKARGLA
jgi:sugar phosphate isomerase/epimerase